MSDQSHHDNTLTDDAAIDALARRAGAEVRRPAPDGFADGVRRTRRRQQRVRAGLGSAGLTAIVAIGVITLSRGGTNDSVVPATAPPTTSAPGVGPTIPPIGTDADGIPDGIYVPADDGITQQDVFDPITLALRDTIPASFRPGEPRSGGISASGGVTYRVPGAEAERDACNQTRVSDWVTGADVSGLPEWVGQIVISADGRVGAAITAPCPTDGGAPTGSSDVTAVVFDPDRPQAPRTVLTVDGADEAPGPDSLELSDDGSFLLVTTTPRPVTEGIASQIRIIDTASADVVAAIGKQQSGDLPRTDCGLGFVSMSFVSSTALAYTAICPDGLAVVIRDLVDEETLEVLQPEYAGRTYETMPSASMVVDRATFTSPSNAWFILCAARESTQGDGTTVLDAPGSHPCWLGHGDQAMREIPARTILTAGFEPIG